MTNILKKIKTLPIDLWFFIGFLLTFTLSVRKVLFYFPIQGAFNEYTGIYLYASDIFLCLTFASWLLIILRNKLLNLSSFKLWINSTKLNFVLILPAFLTILSFISILWSPNKLISVYQSIKLSEFYLLYLYSALRLIPFILNKKNKMFHVEHFLGILIALGFIQSIIGISQVIIQHSIGLIWLKESLVAPSIPGVAKIILRGHRVIRAYGLMPHPNILGGYLLLSLISFFCLVDLKNINVPCGTFSESSTTSFQNKISKKRFFDINYWIAWIIFPILALGLLTTLSKSAIIGLILALLFLNVPRGTFLKSIDSKNLINQLKRALKKMFHVEHLRIYLTSLTVLILAAIFILKPNFHSIFIQSLVEREIYLNLAYKTIIASYLIGLGAGQFVWKMGALSKNPLKSWQYQPVHNVFLLIWSELGVFGLGIVLAMFWHLLRPRYSTLTISKHEYSFLSIEKIRSYFQAVLLGYIFIMLFDHYFWDIQQGNLMLWMVIGIIAGLS